jgi:hypothetical protein
MLYEKDLWGGSHILDDTTMIYSINRTCGLFSNLTVAMYGIMSFYSINLLPKSLSLILTEYDDKNHDFYLDLFKPNDIEINFNDLDKNEMFNFYRYCEPNSLGIGRRIDDVNFKIINKLMDKYFTFSDECNSILNDIINKHNINFSNTVFLWARKTDKIFETKLPEVETYLKLIKDHNLNNFDIILQTDDINVLNEFKSLNLKFRTLEEIPYSFDNSGFHQNLNLKHSNDSFKDVYNISKIEYLQKLICLAKISSMCEYSITYPGCLSTFIPILKGSFTNKLSFKNEKDLII